MTLVEILIALVLIALAVLALVGFQLQTFRSQAQSEATGEATRVATSLLNAAVGELKWDFTMSVAATRQPVRADLDTRALGLEYEMLESFDDPPDNQLKNLEVRVYWSDKNGGHSLNFATKVASP